MDGIRYQRRGGARRERLTHADAFSEPLDGLDRLGQIEADIEMPKLVAFPGVRVPAPKLEHHRTCAADRQGGRLGGF